MASLTDVIRERGPMTVAAFMDLALYDSRFGYYARASQRSGRAGDFFTSVDVGTLFGELLAVQIAEMAATLSTQYSIPGCALVEAGAGNGRLSADILRAVRSRDPELYTRLSLHLVEASGSARAAQPSVLGEVADRLVSSGPELPDTFAGVLIANELLDALPVHQVVMREEGLREVYVDATNGEPTIKEGPPSTPALVEYLARLQVRLLPGWRAEINLNAVNWVREAARRLERGFIILIDYGHEASELYSVTHAAGTLTTYSRHTTPDLKVGPARVANDGTHGASVPWLDRPGEQDITAHVDFTSVRLAAEAEGLTTIGVLDQTYFLLGLVDLKNFENRENLENLKKRLALKTLLLPGGLGSTMKVLILGKGVGAPRLRGCSYRVRVT